MDFIDIMRKDNNSFLNSDGHPIFFVDNENNEVERKGRFASIETKYDKLTGDIIFAGQTIITLSILEFGTIDEDISSKLPEPNSIVRIANALNSDQYYTIASQAVDRSIGFVNMVLEKLEPNVNPYRL